ncbi:hypothetical protein IV203_001629 [Nitzschia inconspicua]|uniref:Uncharacterized protein n=1 Tax=Nitzschia inconspicua TaxID=303405 RepID=A0A9K3L9R7_9STRA|nr:hypothetical protein IV203_001629 [Nitzschia inconspicua]
MVSGQQYFRQRGPSLTRFPVEGSHQKPRRSLNNESYNAPMASQLQSIRQPSNEPFVAASYSGRPPAKHPDDLRQKRGTKNGSGCQAMFSSIFSCNELMYDRCDECADDDISYTYGNHSKNSATNTTSTEESNTTDESTLDNSTILSHTLHADWETIASGTMNGPIYRDVDESRSDVQDVAPLVENAWHKIYDNSDDAQRDAKLHNQKEAKNDFRSRSRSRRILLSGRTTTTVGKKELLRSSRGDKTKGEVHTLHAANSVTKTPDQNPMSSATRSRTRCVTTRTRSRSPTRSRSLGRRSNHNRRNVRARSVPLKPERERYVPSRKTTKSRSKLRKPSGTNVSAESRQRRSQSKSPCEEDGTKSNFETQDIGKLVSISNCDKISRPSRSGPKKSRKKIPIRRPQSRSRSVNRLWNSQSKPTAAANTEKKLFRSRFRVRSPLTNRENENDKYYLKTNPPNTEQEVDKNEANNDFYTESEEKRATKSSALSSRSISVPKSRKTSDQEQNSEFNETTTPVNTGFFTWRKKKRDKPVRLEEAPRRSENLLAKIGDLARSDSLAFPVPNEEGQEIAIQDNEHCYEDPANVHSMLTMPSMDLQLSNEQFPESVDEPKLVVALTANEDGTLVTDDGALYANHEYK